MAASEQRHPFYKPLWRRVAIVAVIVFWLAVELHQGGSSVWVAISTGMLVYAVYTFFLTWPKGDPPGDGTPKA